LPAGASIYRTTNVEQIHVVAVSGDVVHPGQTVQLQIEHRFGRVSCAVHIQQNFIGCESLHALWVLIAHIEPDPGIDSRNGELLHDDGRFLGHDGGYPDRHDGERPGQMPRALQF
jgi:hypothetical protein